MTRPTASPHGVLVVDKPAGPTSHDVVARARRALGERRVGHTGTLDPFATGVLPLCVGKATRLARFLGGGVKVYRATLRLGFATTTDDVDGQPLGPPCPVNVGADELRRACRVFEGEIEQVPPAFSAKRVAGRRLYDLARQGVETERRAVRVAVHAVEVLSCTGERAEIEVRCGAGTYVRALARDIGAALGVGAHLETLRRTHNGDFSLDQAVAWADLEPGVGERLLPLEALLSGLPAVQVGEDGRQALRHGRDLDRRLVVTAFPETPPERMRVLDAQDGALLALAVPVGFENGPGGPAARLHPDLVLAD